MNTDGNLAKKRTPRARSNRAVAVKNILESTFRTFGIADEVQRYEFVLHWREIVGEEIARRARPEALRGKKLVLRVTDSVWAQELALQKELILRRLRPFLREGQGVEDIMFVVG